MALTGNCIYHTSEPTGETEEVEVTYPDGSIQTIDSPTYNQIETSYEDVYIAIVKIDTQQHYFLQEDGSYTKNQIVFIDFGAWESRDARNENPEEPIFLSTTQIADYDYDANTYSQGYDAIKLVPGMENLVND